jgi:hypothetical protein
MCFPKRFCCPVPIREGVSDSSCPAASSGAFGLGLFFFETKAIKILADIGGERQTEMRFESKCLRLR